MKSRDVKLVVVGLGNIGSALLPHVARLPSVKRLTLVDSDYYGPSNLSSQIIDRSDVSRSKVVVQKDKLRRLRRDQRIEAIAARVETVPVGALRADLVLGCLDNRAARQHLAEFCWRLGTCYIDAGVQAGFALARVTTVLPAPGRACFECAWDERHYAGLEEAYPCAPRASAAGPTGAGSALGGLAAALQALQCEELLKGDVDDPGADVRELILEAANHRFYATSIRRNPNCRFDHTVWTVEVLDRVPREIGIGELLDRGALKTAGSSFVTGLSCSGCGLRRRFDRPQSRASFTADDLRCNDCGGRRFAGGSEILEQLDRSAVPAADLDLPLSALGLRPRDIVQVDGARGWRNYQLGPAEPEPAPDQRR